jgi:hypothetical protein
MKKETQDDTIPSPPPNSVTVRNQQQGARFEMEK